MTQQDADDREISTEEAARRVQEEPALRHSAGSEDGDAGVDDEPATPERPVSHGE